VRASIETRVFFQFFFDSRHILSGIMGVLVLCSVKIMKLNGDIMPCGATDMFVFKH
jgi:hypothetical protein